MLPLGGLHVKQAVATWEFGYQLSICCRTEENHGKPSSTWPSPLNLNSEAVPTTQKTHCVYITKTNRLMLFGETVAVYCVNHMEHTNTLCGQNAGLLNVKGGGAHSYHCGLKINFKSRHL
jgi:hypothetical protein